MGARKWFPGDFTAAAVMQRTGSICKRIADRRTDFRDRVSGESGGEYGEFSERSTGKQEENYFIRNGIGACDYCSYANVCGSGSISDGGLDADCTDCSRHSCHCDRNKNRHTGHRNRKCSMQRPRRSRNLPSGKNGGSHGNGRSTQPICGWQGKNQPDTVRRHPRPLRSA